MVSRMAELRRRFSSKFLRTRTADTRTDSDLSQSFRLPPRNTHTHARTRMLAPACSHAHSPWTLNDHPNLIYTNLIGWRFRQVTAIDGARVVMGNQPSNRATQDGDVYLLVHPGGEAEGAADETVSFRFARREGEWHHRGF